MDFISDSTTIHQFRKSRMNALDMSPTAIFSINNQGVSPIQNCPPPSEIRTCVVDQLVKWKQTIAQ